MTGPVSVCNTIATMLYWKTGAVHGSDEKRYDEIYSLVLEHFRTPFGELKER